MSTTTTETTATLPKFLRIDSNPEDKAEVQSLRARFSVSEKQLVHALLILANSHPAHLLSTCNKIREKSEKVSKSKKSARSVESVAE